mmetsp:Transcript_39064/g.104832  ORF Transcript_39064/g.104832 Transcript_39064/m.104832 type:complete len:105 (-) Transcript_39064:1367-1681(-)
MRRPAHPLAGRKRKRRSEEGRGEEDGEHTVPGRNSTPMGLGSTQIVSTTVSLRDSQRGGRSVATSTFLGTCERVTMSEVTAPCGLHWSSAGATLMERSVRLKEV